MTGIASLTGGHLSVENVLCRYAGTTDTLSTRDAQPVLTTKGRYTGLIHQHDSSLQTQREYAIAVQHLRIRVLYYRHGGCDLCGQQVALPHGCECDPRPARALQP